MLVLLGLLLSTGRVFAGSSGPPFVGCSSDGQMGPKAAPDGRTPSLQISAELVEVLAWYQSADAPGVLAPRGWHCFGTYGSSGATLYVSPMPINPSRLFDSKWKGFEETVVEISRTEGGTSGRFAVARLIARLFPEHIGFTQAVIAEGLEPAASFPLGPYPHDRLRYRTKTLVDFETPSQKEGLGTQSKLQASSLPIRGFAFLKAAVNEDVYALTLRIRLSLEDWQISEAIREVMEQQLDSQEAK